MDLIQRRRVILAAGKKPRLPREYQEVEWIRFAGSHYIDTGYKPVPTTEITSAFVPNQFSGGYILGVSVGTNYCLVAMNRGYKFNFNLANAGGFNIIIAGNVGTLYSFTFNANILRLNENTYPNPGVGPSININLFIGARNRDNTAQSFGYFDSREFMLADITGATRDLIPCYRKSDNKPGMYDLCGSICPLTNSPFYINAGTGEFLIGPDVN